MTKRWKQRPPGSTWGDWGKDDELGRINLVTPEKVLQVHQSEMKDWATRSSSTSGTTTR